MSATIDIPDEVYAQLEREAKARGLTVSQTIVQCLAESERARIAVNVACLNVQKGGLVDISPKQSAICEVGGIERCRSDIRLTEIHSLPFAAPVPARTSLRHPCQPRCV